MSRRSERAPEPKRKSRQLGDVGGDAPGLVAREEFGRRPPSRLLLAIDVSERLPVGVADNEGRPSNV